MKIKKPLITLGSLLIAGGLFFGYKFYKYQNRLFKNPKNLSQKIANYVVENGEKIKSTKTNERDYIINFTRGNLFYKIKINHSEKGEKSMVINFYSTNQNFENIKTFGESIISRVEHGNPCIYIKKSFYDWKIDGKLDIEHMLLKQNKNHGYDCFTSKDWDSITQYVYNGGERRLYILKKNKREVKNVWDTAFTGNFNDILLDISRHYKIK